MTPRGRARSSACRAVARGALLLVAVAILAACASSTSSPSSGPTTAVPITDFKMVAGKWAGPLRGLAGPRDDEGDWVQMTIAESGAYEFSIARTIGVATGKGTFNLKDGKLELGITGEDLLREKIAPEDRSADVILRLGFGPANVVVAVPECWLDVAAMSDLDEVAESFYERHGRRLRVATKY